jgi:hypothetical protein
MGIFVVISGIIRRVAAAYGVPVHIGVNYEDALTWLEDHP